MNISLIQGEYILYLGDVYVLIFDLIPIGVLNFLFSQIPKTMTINHVYIKQVIVKAKFGYISNKFKCFVQPAIAIVGECREQQ